MKTLVLLTDFGLSDGYVGVMKGVVWGICPEVRFIDLSHEVRPQQVQEAAFLLWNSYRYFPSGTLFMSVVDPGVGTDRPIALTRVGRYWFLAPENGVLDWVLGERPGDPYLHLDLERLEPGPVSHTFHGRDLFAPAAAKMLQHGDPAQWGKPAAPPQSRWPLIPVDRPGVYRGKVVYIDHFGNAITNLILPDGIGPAFAQTRGQQWPFRSTYGQVAPGALLSLKASHGLLELAAGQGSAAQTGDLAVGDPLTFEWHPFS